MKRTWIALSSIVGALLFLVFVGISHRSPATTRTMPPAPALLGVAPDFSLLDLGGRPLMLSQYRGSVVLVNFWATWCAPCLEEIPALMSLQTQYGDRGLVVIGVAMDEAASVAPFVHDRRFSIAGILQTMNYPIVIGTDAVADSFGGVIGLPTTVLVSRDGRRTASIEGPIDPEAIQQTIQSMLQRSSQLTHPGV